VSLSDGTLYALYRTTDGYLCAATSRDRGLSFTPPAYATYRPGGRAIKNPRAFAFARRFSNGKYLLWFHNNGGEAVHALPHWDYYQDRNPGWVCGGEERSGTIHWSEPEILLYDEDARMRFSYPDFIEEDGKFWITATNKEVARCHPIDRTLLDGLWAQPNNRERAPGFQAQQGILKPEPGFAVDFRIRFQELTPDQVLIEAPGFILKTGPRFNLIVQVHDAQWESDYGTHAGTLRTETEHHIGLIADGGPRLLLWLVDGLLNDGGATRQFGWGRYRAGLPELNLAKARLHPAVRNFYCYDRALRVSEMVGNSRASR
jgi:hypothetical protein